MWMRRPRRGVGAESGLTMVMRQMILVVLVTLQGRGVGGNDDENIKEENVITKIL